MRLRSILTDFHPHPKVWETGEPSGNLEAAKYRTRLREAEAQRDALAQRVERLQRLDIERVAAESLSAPVDLWLNGNRVEAYLDDAGNVDAERVREDAKLLVTERPGLRKLSPAVDPTQGQGGNPGKSTPTFSDLLS